MLQLLISPPIVISSKLEISVIGRVNFAEAVKDVSRCKVKQDNSIPGMFNSKFVI